MATDAGKLMLKNPAPQQLPGGGLPREEKSFIGVPKGTRDLARASVSPDWSALG